MLGWLTPAWPWWPCPALPCTSNAMAALTPSLPWIHYYTTTLLRHHQLVPAEPPLYSLSSSSPALVPASTKFTPSSSHSRCFARAAATTTTHFKLSHDDDCSFSPSPRNFPFHCLTTTNPTTRCTLTCTSPSPPVPSAVPPPRSPKP